MPLRNPFHHPPYVITNRRCAANLLPSLELGDPIMNFVKLFIIPGTDFEYHQIHHKLYRALPEM